MTTTRETGRGVRASRSPLLPRLLAAGALAVNAYVHVDLAQGPLAADGQLTLAALFLGDAVAAVTAGLWLLLRPSRLAWCAVAAVATASFLALVVTTYVSVPAVGPLPAVYEPFWYAAKVTAALAALVAAVTALATLATSRHSDGEGGDGDTRRQG